MKIKPLEWEHIGEFHVSNTPIGKFIIRETGMGHYNENWCTVVFMPTLEPEKTESIFESPYIKLAKIGCDNFYKKYRLDKKVNFDSDILNKLTLED